MSLDTARSGVPPDRFTADEARQRLEHERDTRLAQLVIDEVAHEGDDRMVAAQKEAINRVLREIDAAFDRIRDGDYGTCQECRRPIPVERLEILPYARCCVPCQGRVA